MKDRTRVILPRLMTKLKKTEERKVHYHSLSCGKYRICDKEIKYIAGDTDYNTVRFVTSHKTPGSQVKEKIRNTEEKYDTM